MQLNGNFFENVDRNFYQQKHETNVKHGICQWKVLKQFWHIIHRSIGVGEHYSIKTFTETLSNTFILDLCCE